PHGRQADARQRVRRADASGARPREPPPALADGAHHQPRCLHRRHRGDREPGDRTPDVPALGVRQGRDRCVHHHGSTGDAVQLPRLPCTDRRRGHLYVARAHAALGFSLHLARRQGAGGAGTNMMAFLLAWLLGILQAPPPPKQAVVETSAGTFIIDLAPDQAPLTTAYFRKTAAAGGYNGTIFHKMIKYGIVQGGDPLSRDPAKRAQWGTGGLNAVKDEARAAKMTRGSVAAVTIPGKPDSAGQQFFIAVVDQPGLDGKYTVLGHVSDGIEVVQKISETPIDDKGVATERIEIKSVTIRDTPPVLFVNDSVQDLATYRAVLDTTAGSIAIEFLPDKAKETVRQFLRLAEAGVYNNVAFHRVAPGFVIQTGAMNTRSTPLVEKQQKLIHNQPPEIND